MLVAASVVAARYERVQPLNSVDQPVLQQEIERTIDRRRDRVALRLFQPVEQRVGPDGTVRFEDEPEYVTPDVGQACAFPRARRRGGLQPAIDAASVTQCASPGLALVAT